ncbi:MAG: glutamate-1-semialdehyde 2,1-aminomutase [Kiritimatiellota bacterium]|nr:glutamate-1-semialdehyde 2,1-aminomutase [Kiritimatiellota bacterium]
MTFGGVTAALFKRACRVMPGGVNSPVRAFKAVGGTPVFIERGRGSRIYSADGRELIDFCGSWGPLILGHAHPEVVEAVRMAAAKGLSFGACTRAEVELAELLRARVPYLEMVRLVNSGTEATMTAIRLARGFTGRKKILKFDGCYHGHVDGLLVSAGSGLLTSGIASSAGVPEGIVADVLVAPYNDLDAVALLMEKYSHDVAAIIVEPVAGNMGLVPPAPGFLEGLRKLTADKGALLIFDEVITGFRLGPTTYGILCGITPDLTCLGKIIGGGMPIGAVGGRTGIMQRLAPLGAVYQAGTLSGNPVAVAAGLSTLKVLIAENPYSDIARRAKKVGGWFENRMFSKSRKTHCANIGGMFTIFFCERGVRNLADAKRCDTRRYARFFHGMLERGVYLPPSQFEVCFISVAHTDKDMEYFIKAMDEVLLARDSL